MFHIHIYMLHVQVIHMNYRAGQSVGSHGTSFITLCTSYCEHNRSKRYICTMVAAYIVVYGLVDSMLAGDGGGPGSNPG